MSTVKEPRRVIGEAKCHVCDGPIKVRITEKNKLYANCIEASGGCGAQIFSRSVTADKHLARRITKWVDANERRAYLGDEDLPEKTRPKPTPAPAPTPEPTPEPEEPEPDDPPPPPALKRPVPPQFRKGPEKKEAEKKPFWDL